MSRDITSVGCSRNRIEPVAIGAFELAVCDFPHPSPAEPRSYVKHCTGALRERLPPLRKTRRIAGSGRRTTTVSAVVLRSTAFRAATVLALILSLGILSTIVATSASAETVASKKAEAQRIAAQLDRLAERASILDEDYNEARVKASDLENRTRNAQVQLARTTAKAQTATSALKQLSISAYMKGGFNPSGVVLGSADAARAAYYLHATANRQKDAIDALHAAKQQLAEQQGVLASQRDRAQSALATVDAKRKAAATAAAEQRALLARVKGDLARLVAAEQTRRAGARASRGRTKANLGTPPGVDFPAPTAAAAAAVAEAKRQLGKPYQWGAAGPDSFDCSGLTSWAWRVGGGKSLPHSSRAQYASTSRVSLDDIKPGDLTFYGSSVGSIHHVGIYAGGGYMVDAPETGRNVQYVRAFRNDLVGIGRVN
ncbi:MAG TPA: NlpC/P60 family protein [Acidimicrobiales bacterium]|nr:NlpC/P60 family protein [Acidimicrobiales bacterium]